MGLSRILDLSRRSMATYQRALDITAHNISNSSNAEYSRQAVVLSTETPEVVSGFTWGTGVKLDAINRVRNDMIDAQLRVNNQNFHDNYNRAQLLGEVEQLFTEPSDLGLSNLMSNFFSSWQELALTPNSIPLRQDVVNSAEQISVKVKTINDGLDVIKSDLFSDTKGIVQSLNHYVEQVQTLNKQIFEAQQVGNTASDLRDKRDTALDEISKLVNVTIAYDKNESALLSFGGVFAADRSNFTTFSMQENNGQLQVVSDGGQVVKLTGGELKAKTEVYSKYIPEYRQELDTIISSMVSAVNAEHRKGYTIGVPVKTGIDFFDSYINGNLKVSEDIKNDPKLIAASSDGTNGSGGVAVKIGDVALQNIVNGATLTDGYSAFISKMGTDVFKSQQIYESNNLVVQQLQEQRTSYSSVSIDEEMANVIKFQRSYEASAKLISIADELIQTILGLV